MTIFGGQDFTDINSIKFVLNLVRLVSSEL